MHPSRATQTPEFLDKLARRVRSKRLDEPTDDAACVTCLMSGDGEQVDRQTTSANGGVRVRS